MIMICYQFLRHVPPLISNVSVLSLQISVISIELDFKLLIYLTEPVQVCHLLQIWFSKNHKYIIKKI